MALNTVITNACRAREVHHTCRAIYAFTHDGIVRAKTGFYRRANTPLKYAAHVATPPSLSLPPGKKNRLEKRGGNKKECAQIDARSYVRIVQGNDSASPFYFLAWCARLIPSATENLHSNELSLRAIIARKSEFSRSFPAGLVIMLSVTSKTIASHHFGAFLLQQSPKASRESGLRSTVVVDASRRTAFHRDFVAAHDADTDSTAV